MPVSVPVLNTTSEPWDAAVCVGWQLFEPGTGRLVLEGPRTPLPRPLAPGESVEVEIDAPALPGRYLAFFSAMREGDCWFHERGVPFLLAEVEDGRILSRRIATSAALRRARALRRLSRFFSYPLQSIWRNRGLIASMVRRDIVGRYRGSFAGLFWTVLNPALLMITYFFVFGIVLQTRFAGDPSRCGFALYFLCGMLPWLAFSEAAGRAPFTVIEHVAFVKKLVFPIEILPVNLSAAGLVTEAFALVIFAVFLAVIRHGVPLAIAWLPAILLPQVLFTMGIAWVMAAAGPYVRDLGQVNGFLLTLWFFVTPICYPENSLPASIAGILKLNPMYVFVRAYRNVFLEAGAPDLAPLLGVSAVSLLVFFAGHAFFYKLRKSFADIL